jgi:hypothetical protein
MTRDNLDRSLWIALFLIAAAAIALPFLSQSNPIASNAAPSGRANDQKLLREARILIIQKRYEPVEALMKSNQHQQALLKLEEIARSYPSDPHAFILRGELLAILGAPAEAASSFAQGVKLEGGYVDRNSPTSRRESISRLVESELTKSKPLSSDSSAQTRLNDIRYLQSRLAGGCE